MLSTTVAVPFVTALALAVLVVRLRVPARQTPVAVAVEVLSLALSAVLVADLLMGVRGWATTLATMSLYATFGLTLAFALGMGRAASAAVVTDQRRAVPFDAIVSFGGSNAVAAGLAGAMVIAAAGGGVAALVATVAVLRVLATRSDLDSLAASWRWDDRPGTA